MGERYESKQDFKIEMKDNLASLKKELISLKEEVEKDQKVIEYISKNLTVNGKNANFVVEPAGDSAKADSYSVTTDWNFSVNKNPIKIKLDVGLNKDNNGNIVDLVIKKTYQVNGGREYPIGDRTFYIGNVLCYDYKILTKGKNNDVSFIFNMENTCKKLNIDSKEVNNLLTNLYPYRNINDVFVDVFVLGKNYKSITQNLNDKQYVYDQLKNCLMDSLDPKILDTYVRGEIAKKGVSDLFDTKANENYFKGLAVGTIDVAKDQQTGGYIVDFVAVSVDDDKKVCQSIKSDVLLKFDKYGNLSSNEITIPKLFGSDRKFVLDNKTGKFVEDKDSKQIRKDKETANYDKISKMLMDEKSTAGGYVLDDEPDFEGNYGVKFTTPMFENSKTGEIFNGIDDQEFRLKIDTDGKIKPVKAEEYIQGDNGVSVESVFGKDLYGSFSVNVEGSGGNQYVEIVTKLTNKKESVDSGLSIEGLDGDISPFYEKNTKNLFIKHIDGGKYSDLVDIKLSDNEKNIESPNEIVIKPIDGDYLDVFADDSDSLGKKQIASMVSCLTDPKGIYKLKDTDIKAVVEDYNKPIEQKLYKIVNPITKEVKYYSCSKKDNNIVFEEDEKVKKYIETQRSAFRGRFELIKNNFDKEMLAQKALLEKEFEKKGNKNIGNNIGLIPWDVIQGKPDDVNILDKNYDVTKVRYQAGIWYSSDRTKNLDKADGVLPNNCQKKGSLYFDYEGNYDKKLNNEMYDDDNERVVIAGAKGRFRDVNGTICFVQDQK